MSKVVGIGTTLLAAGVLVGGIAHQARAQTTAVWSFENVGSGVNSPGNLGDSPIGTFTVQSDDGLLTATFQTISPSTQFGIHDNAAEGLADAPISGNLLFGGRTNYPDASGAYGTAAIKVSFSKPITDFGFDFLDASQDIDLQGVSESLVVDLSPLGLLTLTANVQNSSQYYYQYRRNVLDQPFMFSTLFGALPTPISNMVLSVTPRNDANAYAEFGIDNLSVKYAGSTVPEPGTLALLAGVILPLAWLRKKRSA